MESLTDIQKYQIFVALVVAKYLSRDGSEVCGLDGVNEMLSMILASDFTDEHVDRAIRMYETSKLKDEQYLPMVEALSSMITQSLVPNENESIEDRLRALTSPYSPSVEQTKRLIEMAISMQNEPQPDSQ